MLLQRCRPSVWKTSLINELSVYDSCPVWLDSSTAFAKDIHCVLPYTLQEHRKKSPNWTHIWLSHLDTGMEACCFSSAGPLAHCWPLLTGMLYCHPLGLRNVTRGSVTVDSAENERKCNFLSSILSKVCPKLPRASISCQLHTQIERLLFSKFERKYVCLLF